MPVHCVQQGECLSTIATRYGVGGWQTLYDHPGNADLRKTRPNPNVLFPGDNVFVPEKGEPKRVDCSTEKRHRFTVKIPSTSLRVVLEDPDEQPLAGKKYIIKIGEKEIHGVTGADGLIKTEVPLNECSASLSAWLYAEDTEEPDFESELLIGHLDPVSTVSGIQARLKNLGFYCDVDGDLGPQTEAAISRFREKNGMPTDVEDPVDDALRDKLVELHEGV
jgi:N-acetylmuramoyl-L-alanine amidase